MAGQKALREGHEGHWGEKVIEILRGFIGELQIRAGLLGISGQGDACGQRGHWGSAEVIKSSAQAVPPRTLSR